MKKNFLIFDFIVQTLLTLLFIVFAINSPGAFIPFLLFLFVIGIWQFLGAILYLMFSDPLPRKNYFLVASGIFLGFIILWSVSVIEEIREVFLFTFPTMAAIWYYSITFQEMINVLTQNNSSEN